MKWVNKINNLTSDSDIDVGSKGSRGVKGIKQIQNGRFIGRGYAYRGYELRNHGYYPPDKCRWWEAVNVETGEAEFHAHTRRELCRLIDSIEGVKGCQQKGENKNENETA